MGLAAWDRPRRRPGCRHHRRWLLPVLAAPDGIALQANGSAAGPNLLASDAAVDAPVAVADLEAHFAQQLEAAGWTRLARSAAGPLAWSTWRVPSRDGEWRGFLYALEGAAPQRRTLHVHVEAATGPVAVPAATRPPFPIMATPTPVG